MLPELLANTSGPITLLSTAVNASATALQVSVAAPTPLQATGQFRIRVDSELMLVTANPATTTWTVERGIEGTVAAEHAGGTEVFHLLTVGGLRAATAAAGRAVHAITGAQALAWGADYYCEAGSDYELALPTAVGHAGEDIRVRVTSGTHAITLKGSQTIDGEPSVLLGLEPSEPSRAITITSDGSVLHTF